MVDKLLTGSKVLRRSKDFWGSNLMSPTARATSRHENPSHANHVSCHCRTLRDNDRYDLIALQLHLSPNKAPVRCLWGQSPGLQIRDMDACLERSKNLPCRLLCIEPARLLEIQIARFVLFWFEAAVYSTVTPWIPFEQPILQSSLYPLKPPLQSGLGF